MLNESQFKAQKTYAATDKGRASFAAGRARWIEKNKHKRRAAEAVRRAVKSGKLIKPVKCDGCKSEVKLHGHHNDYGFPLSVSWLCCECHKSWHRIFGKAKHTIVN